MWLYHILKVIIVPLIKLYHRIEVYGKDRFDPKRHYLVVGNHISHLDPFYIAAFYPHPLHFMAKKELFNSKILKWLLEHLGAFPVNRQAADVGAIKTSLRILKSGKSMGIFPEGTRVDHWDEQAFKQGAAYLALKSNIPVLPVAIFGTNLAMPRGKSTIKPKKVRILYGKPISALPEETMDEFGIRIRKEIEKLLAEGKKKNWPTY